MAGSYAQARGGAAAGRTTTRARPATGSGHPVLALQRSAGNRAVASILEVQRAPRNRRRRNGGGVPITKTEKSTPTPSPTPKRVDPPPTTPPTTSDQVAETTGAITGGLLDVWEGVETVVDPSKPTSVRVGGGSKAVGGLTAVGSNTTKSLGLITDSTGDMYATITEACGFVATAGELYAAVSEAYSRGVTDTLLELAKGAAGLLAGALKTAEAYAKYVESKVFDDWIAKGVIPSLGIVNAAVKIFGKARELWTLSVDRARVVAASLKVKASSAGRKSAEHLVSLMDTKWYRTLVEILSSTAELSGEALKWADWSIGWLTGSVVGAVSKVFPLGFKLVNYLWQTANDWGGTRIWGGQTTSQLVGSSDQLVRVITGRPKTDPLVKVLCEVLGIDLNDSRNRDVVTQKVALFAA